MRERLPASHAPVTYRAPRVLVRLDGAREVVDAEPFEAAQHRDGLRRYLVEDVHVVDVCTARLLEQGELAYGAVDIPPEERQVVADVSHGFPEGPACQGAQEVALL